jgi:hypothetical protein
LARTIYIWFIYGGFGREISNYTVIYGVYIRFWPTLHIIYVVKRSPAAFRKRWTPVDPSHSSPCVGLYQQELAQKTKKQD